MVSLREKEVNLFIHCRTCVACKPQTMPMREYGRYEISVTTEGLLVSCVRHNRPVVRLTPEILKQMINQRSSCELCITGTPHTHGG